MIKRFTIFLTILALSTYGSITHTRPILIPTDLNPGDSYQLAFDTSTRRDGTSDNVADYNAFVQAAADTAWLGGGSILDGVRWRAIVSTTTIDANQNAPVYGPVYNLNNERFANDYADMWDDSHPTRLNWDEYGVTEARAVWTGTAVDGSGATLLQLGNQSGFSVWGLNNFSSSPWINLCTYQPSNLCQNPSILRQSTLRHVYALSEELVVPTISAPATLALFALGLVSFGITRRKRTCLG